MANKRITDLPLATSTTVGDKLPIDGDTTRSITVEHFLADNLVAIRALTGAADKGIQFTGPGAVETYDLTAAGKALLDDDDAEAQRATLGLENVDNTSDADKPISSATQTALDAKANSDDLGSAAAHDAADFATAAQGAKADSAVQPDDLAVVATSGDYGDLTNQPFTVPAGGSTGQVLAKNSGTDGDTEWINESGGSPDPTIAYAWQLGMRGDNATENSAILQAWADGLPSKGGKVIFGPGKFRFSEKVKSIFQPSATGPTDDKNTFGSITLDGAGHDLTELFFDGSDGLEFACSSFQHTVHIHHLSITTNQNGGYTGIKITNSFPFFGSYTAQHEIDSVTIRGEDGYGASNYWSKCIDAFNITNLNIDNCNIYGPVDSAAAGAFDFGTGIDLASDPQPDPDLPPSTTPGWMTSINISRTNLVFLGVGANIGNGVQAVCFSNGTAILNGAAGINVAAGLEEVRQIMITGAQIAVNDNGVIFGSGVSGCAIVGNYFHVAPGKNGIVFATDDGAPSGGGTTIVGNTFVPLDAGAENGVYVNTSFNPITIVGNTFQALGAGVALDSGSQAVTVQSNAYVGCTNDVVDSGSGNIVGDGAWRTYTPTVTAGSGAFTNASATGRYRRSGKTVYFSIQLAITTNGSAATNIQLSVPPSLPFASNTALLGRENSVTGFGCSVLGSSSTIYVTKYDGTYLGSNGYSLSIDGSYETP